MRKFNIAGNCVKTKHYMVDISNKLKKIKRMVDDGDYFTINRARQYGKTTTLYSLREMLNDEYMCLKISFEGIGCEDFVSSEAFCQRLLQLLDNETVSEYKQSIWLNANINSFGDLSSHISEVCKGRKIVILIDEVDKSSNNQIFLHFLGVLRSKYLARTGNGSDTFHSVILAGVNDIKNIKQNMIAHGTHTISDGEKIHNSPWNIAADFEVDMSFSPQEIETLLSDYESEHSMGMNIPAIAREIHNWTDGYPFLVSCICKTIDEKLDADWRINSIQNAVKIILKKNNTLFQDIFKNLENNPEFSKFMYSLLIQGNSYSFNIDTPLVSLGAMYGILKDKDGRTAVSNKIFETRIAEYFIEKEKQRRGIIETVIQDDVVKNGRFDMETCLRKFAQHYYEMFKDSNISFLEEHGTLLFLTYLRPLINGSGFFHLETETRNSRRMDVIVDYGKEQFIIELKIWRGPQYKEESYDQLLDYMNSKNAATGYLITFDFRKESNKQRQAEWLEFDGVKRIFDVMV